MLVKFLTLSLVLAMSHSSAFASCLEYGILGLNAKKGGSKSLNKTAAIAAGGTLAGTYITSSVAVAKSAEIGASCIAVGASAILATGVIAGVATVGVTSYLIKRSKNTNTDLLELAHQILTQEISVESFDEANQWILKSHVKLSRHLKRFLRLKNELNEKLGVTLNNYDLAELIVYLDKNAHVKNSERIHPPKGKSLTVINPFCSFSKTKLELKGFKLNYQLTRKTYKHKNMIKNLIAAFNAKSINSTTLDTDEEIEDDAVEQESEK